MSRLSCATSPAAGLRERRPGGRPSGVRLDESHGDRHETRGPRDDVDRRHRAAPRRTPATAPLPTARARRLWRARSARSPRRVYHAAASGDDVAQAVGRVQSSTALASAIDGGNAGAARRGAARAAAGPDRADRGPARRARARERRARGRRSRRCAARSPARARRFVLSVQSDSGLPAGRPPGHGRAGAAARRATGALAGTIAGPPPRARPDERRAELRRAELPGRLRWPARRTRRARCGSRCWCRGRDLVPGLARPDAVETLGQRGRTHLQGGAAQPECSATLRRLEALARLPATRWPRAARGGHARGDRRLLRGAHPRRARARDGRQGACCRPRRPVRARARARDAAQRRARRRPLRDVRSRTTRATSSWRTCSPARKC